VSTRARVGRFPRFQTQARCEITGRVPVTAVNIPAASAGAAPVSATTMSDTSQRPRADRRWPISAAVRVNWALAGPKARVRASRVQVADPGGPVPMTPGPGAGTFTYPPASRKRIPSTACHSMGWASLAAEAGKG
jgi:hypothetical protein